MVEKRIPSMDVGSSSKKRIGDYILEESDQHKLGEGAFGKVYRAEHSQSGIPVAVKKLAKDKVKFDELRVVSKLNDENVIGIINLHFDVEIRDDRDVINLDKNEDDDDRSNKQEYVFVVLELCDTDLHVHLSNQEDGRLGSIDLDLITESLARGYHALFERSIVHRDMKPENILLKYACNGRIRAAKIGDFGASRLVGGCEDERDEVKLTSLAGTPLYMAPEIGANILADRQYDARVDMWSIGVVLYECINGQVPFDERALCRLFLFSANANYEGYMGPPNPSPPSSTATIAYEALLNRLLELDVRRRLTPQEFHCWIVHQQLLIDQTSVIVVDDGQEQHSEFTSSIDDGPTTNGRKRRQYRLRAPANGCCAKKPIGVRQGRNGFHGGDKNGFDVGRNGIVEDRNGIVEKNPNGIADIRNGFHVESRNGSREVRNNGPDDRNGRNGIRHQSNHDRTNSIIDKQPIDEANNNNHHNGVSNGKCRKCNHHRVPSSFVSTQSPKSSNRSSTISFVLERFFWFSGMFVACNYCCFTMRQYGFDS